MIQRENKVWGERWLLRVDSSHATSVLILKAGTRCSWHRHDEKYNLFCVIAGRVGIKTEDGEVVLGHGETFLTRPGQWHEFRVYEDGIMVEEMFVSYSEGDILRAKVGGLLSEEHGD